MAWSEWFFGPGKGLLRQRRERTVAPGADATPSTAGEFWEGAFYWQPGVGTFVCQKTGVSTWAWQPCAIPTGVLAAFAGVITPAGWLLCDGSAVSRTTYAALWAGMIKPVSLSNLNVSSCTSCPNWASCAG